MRLIGGFVHLDGRPAETFRLDAMAAAMTAPALHPSITRQVMGPVALLTLDFGPVADRAAPADPLQRDGCLILAADIRLDEPVDILDEAGLALALEREGEAGLGRLAGDFALAAWDPRTGTLLCARDGFGVRPLFFVHRPGELFAFASLPRGLHATGLVERAVDPAFIVDELLFRFSGPDRSLFAGVERLAPGGWLRVGLGGQAAQRGWHWRLDPAMAGSRHISPAEAAVELSSLIEGAVRRRLLATGPVAAHLSGGVDSSAIAILAARMLRPTGRGLLAYSLVPAPYGAYRFGGDGSYIDPVLRQEPDIAWTRVQIENPGAIILPLMDEDQLFPADPSHGETRIFADAAARGAGMLLSGWGGDEGCSYTHRAVLAEALLAGRWSYLLRELRAMGTGSNAWDALVPFLLSDNARAAIRAIAGRPAPPPALPSVMAALLRAPHRAGRALPNAPLPPDARRIRYRLLTGHGLPRRTEQWALLAARHGMAAAFPLLDRRVVEFALSLPSDLFIREGWSRRVFRDAMAGVLPDELRWKRSKFDLGSEVVIHLAAQRPLLAERLARLRDRPAIADLFDLDQVAACLHALPPADALARTIDTGLGDPSGLGIANSLMRAFQAMLYLDQHG